MVARILALLAAIGMVAGALVVRDRMDGGGGGGTLGIGGPRPVLVCATELATVCDSFRDKADVTVEPAGTTADRLIAAPSEAGLDGWLVAGPWPAIVAEERKRKALAPILVSEKAGIARSPVVIVGERERVPVLSAKCGGKVTLRCLGDNGRAKWSAIGGQAAWGDVRVGLPNAAIEAEGLAVLGAATVDFFGGRTDLARADLEGDPGYGTWVSQLARSLPQSSDFGRMLAAKGVVDLWAGLEAQVVPQLATATARSQQLDLLYPEPVVTADVTLGLASGKAADRLGNTISGDEGKQALAAGGWRVGSKVPAGARTDVIVAPTSGLPSPGLLQALRSVWKDAL
jgi:hypothetical protein